MVPGTTWARPASFLAAGTVLLTAAGAGLTATTQPGVGHLVSAAHAVLLAGLGALLCRAEPGRRLGGLLLGTGAVAAVGTLAAGWAGAAQRHGWPGASTATWVDSWLWAFLVGPLLSLLPLLYPDGSLPSPRWRPAAGIALLGTVVLAAGGAAEAGGLLVTGAALVAAAVLLGAASLVVRWRRSNGLQRDQLRVLLLAVTLVVLFYAVESTLPRPAAATGFALVPVVLLGAITLAVLRHRLHRLDTALRRTVVVGLLTAGVVGTYAAVVALATATLGSAGPLAPAVAAAVVVVGLEPARRLVHRWVGRLLYGERADPLVALSRLRERLEAVARSEDLLPAAAAALRSAVRSPYVAIDLLHHGHRVQAAADGTPGGANEELPLVHQGERIGTLWVAPRAVGEPFTGADRALLGQLAHQVTAAAWSVRLAEDLAAARAAAVRAAADERDRIRRDLHDGVGPVLVGAGLALQGVRRALPDGAAPGPVLDRISDQVRSAATDVRRIIESLRPGPTGDLTLLAALADHALSWQALPGAPQLRVTGDDVPLPPAVEEAAYLVVLEAVTNVLRHARATRCEVTVACGPVLALSITDDGCGLPPSYVSGVGIASMRHRVLELGGSFAIARRATGGTQVRATIPLQEPA